jgi:hypothetical protein
VEHTACMEQYKIVLGKAGTLFDAQNEMKFRFKCKPNRNIMSDESNSCKHYNYFKPRAHICSIFVI